MTNIATLGFGDDGSEAADTCWQWIQAHRWDTDSAHPPAAAPLRWTLDIITADGSIGPLPSKEEAGLHPWDPPQPRIAAPGTGFAQVRHLTCRLDPRLALSHPVDLLAIGRRGPGILKALHLGSTAEWLVQQPPSPLVVARTTTATGRVLVAHDGSIHARLATTAFARLPWATGTEVTVIVVDDDRADVAAALAVASEDLATGGIGTATFLQPHGHPTKALHAAIDDLHPDLVVLGTRGHTGIRPRTLGSTAATITRTAPCSVMVAAEPHPD